jgi:carboxyl-terminal processing protease
VDIGREILPKGTVVYLIDKAGKKTVYSCDGKNEIKIPLVVLVNGNSASASEILTGAIKDDKIGTVVGTTTYGKGIVQNVLALSDGTAVKITIAAYYTPSGVNIQGKGIEPDIKCEFDSDAYYKDQTDNQLEKAIEVVKSKIK